MTQEFVPPIDEVKNDEEQVTQETKPAIKGLQWDKTATFELTGEQLQLLVNAIDLYSPEIQKAMVLQGAAQQLGEVIKKGVTDGKVKEIYEDESFNDAK